MNQILETKPDSNNYNKPNINSKKILFILKSELYISIMLIIIIISFFINNSIKLYEKEKYSSQILDNYNITKLYSNVFSNDSTIYNENIENFAILGIIEIPKINIYYPIFSTYNDEILKISPCRFYGPMPGNKGNLCIAGHNYDNNKFFSKISHLNVNDEIIIFNNFNKKFSYFVYKIYEVKYDDVSPIYTYDKNSKELTLITCNNLNNNRIIVKALENKSEH